MGNADLHGAVQAFGFYDLAFVFAPDHGEQMSDLRELRQIAEEVARVAGERLRSPEANYRHVRELLAHDIKLHADTETERFMRNELARRSAFPVIGEEEGGDAGLLDGNRYYWIVDPLDGTANYHRSVPLCCVSIGLFHGWTPVLGVVYDFSADELFSGIVAEEFLLNGQARALNWATGREEAILYTGFPSGRDFSEQALLGFLRRVSGYKKVRSLGSAALGLAWVAAGRFDAYYEEGARLWDVAGGIALVQSAGGVFRIKPSNTGKFLAFDVSVAGRADLLVSVDEDAASVEIQNQ